MENSTANDSLPESDNHSVKTDLPLNDCSVMIENVSLSPSESRQDILAKLETAGFDYSEDKHDYSDEAKYDFFIMPQDVFKFIFQMIAVSKLD